METIELGPDRGRLLIKTGRSGLGRRVGHDLTIEATRWSGTATRAGDAAGSSVRVAVAVDGLAVREGTGGVLPLSDQDRTEITGNLRDVLQAGRHPEITFVSTRIEGAPDAFTVEGELTIMGRTEPLSLKAASEGDRFHGEAAVRQTRWGIKPFKAFMGALKLADDVQVTFDLRL